MPRIPALSSAIRGGLRVAGIAAFLLLLSQGGTGATAESLFGKDKDDRENSQEEMSVVLPPAPEAANLLPFLVSPTATHSFSVDARSIAVGEDRVVRYTLVATSPSGAKSVSYEGIYCKTMEKRLYAFGQADGTWSRSRRTNWEAITGRTPHPHHAVLAREFFCQDGDVAGTAAKLVKKLRSDGLRPNPVPPA